MKENLNKTSELDGVRLSPHFKLGEFLNLKKYPENIPSMQIVANLTYGCHQLLVGGVRNSQHLIGQAADIRPKDPTQFQRLVDFLKANALTDQLLTGSTWLHISWNSFAAPRHYIRLGYYK